MKQRKTPPKLDNLCTLIRNCLVNNRYRQSKHAMEMVDERKVNILGVLHVLENGYREEAKDSYDEAFRNWKYSIRGKTLDEVEIRVIISIYDENMIIITVINLDIKD